MRPRISQIILILTVIIACDLDKCVLAASIEEATVRSTIIVDATVVSSKAVEWNASSSYRSCGFEHDIRINEVLAGTAQPSMTIGSPDPLVPGSRYLIHLQEREGDFAKHRNSAWPADIQRSIDECVAKLPLLKSSWPPASQILNLPEPLLVLSNWFVSLDLQHSVMTFDVKEVEFDAGTNKISVDDLQCMLLGEACSKRSIFVWSEFRDWIKALRQDKANKSLNTDAGDAGAG